MTSSPLDEPANYLDMLSVDALATALREFSGGVLIVFRKPSNRFDLEGAMRLTLIFSISSFISQVANELWEVKGKRIQNLTKEDIVIKTYKSILLKPSALDILFFFCPDMILTSDCIFWFQGYRKGQMDQQNFA